jgi:hypothetical protein
MIQRGAMLVMLCIGCGPKHRSSQLEGRFHTGQPGEGWASVKPGGADMAWHNAELAATIYADSNCAERFEDGPLVDLATHLTFGFAEGEPLRQETLELAGRPALRRVVAGLLDGMPVQMGLVITRKHECLYDILYIAPTSAFDSGWAAFESVTSGFEVKGG